MWAKISLLECLEYIEDIKYRLSSKDFNENANFLFCLICFLFIAYFLFYKFVLVSQKYFRPFQFKFPYYLKKYLSNSSSNPKIIYFLETSYQI